MDAAPGEVREDAQREPPMLGARLLTALVLIAIGSIPLLPALLFGRYPHTHEGTRYETLATFFQRALSQGFVYPRWLPELAGGLGYPTFVFYQPGVFYVASFWMSVFGVGSVLAIQLTALVHAVAGSGGAYLLARQFVDRGVAIVCAALFMITPYAFVNLYVRGDHSEFAAMLLTPWPLACLMIAQRRMSLRRSIAAPLIVATASLALIVVTHPAVAMIFVPLAFLMAACSTLSVERSLRWRWLVALAVVGTIAAALSSPYWWTVWRNAQYVRLDRVADGVFSPIEHVVAPWRLVSNFYDFGVSAARSTGRPIGMSFQLGLPHLLLAIAGAWLGRRHTWVLLAAIAYLVLTFLITTLALPFWQLRTPFRVLQFPWRLLAVLAPLQLLLAAAALARVRRPQVAAIVAAVCLVLAAGWYHAMFQPSSQRFLMTDGTARHFSWEQAQKVVDTGVASVSDDAETFAGMNEFEPIWIREIPAFAKRTSMIHAPGSIVRYAGWSSSLVIDAVISSPAPRDAILHQFYFPGWHVEVNGQAIDDATLRSNTLPDGRMRITLPAGDSTLLAYYDGPLGWRTQAWIAAIVSVGGIVCIVLLSRRWSR